MGPQPFARQWSLVAVALLRLFPRMRQYADRAREHEKAACQRRRKPELAIDDGGGAVDVERDLLALAPRDLGLNSLGDVGETSADDAARGKIAGQLDEARRPR